LTPGAWGRRKQAVLVRDKGVCQLAKEVGREPHAINGGWTADHIKPRGLGGATRNDNMNNLRATCNRCHAIAHNLHVHAKKEGNQS
jgi:5-methylcytosine-specific restriction endonuclease McrA